MTADPQTLAWTAFGASALALMGASLAADAETHAEAALQLGGTGQARGALVWAYRLAGAALFAAAGYAAWRGVSRPVHLERPARLSLGALFGVAALARASGKLSARPVRLPRALEADSLVDEPAPTAGRRVARGAAWLLTLDLAAFACYLLWP